jgi:hypothetical protein
MSLGSFFSGLSHKIAAFFGSHAEVIATVIADAQQAVGAASAVAGAVGETQLIPVLSGVSDGLSKVATAVTAESTADTLTGHAAAITALAEGLIESTNDAGIKDANTKAAVGAVLVKVNGVVAALETAATVAK